MRAIVDLGDELVERVRRACEREGISRAELVRRALDEHLSKTESDQRADAFGIWRNRGIDGLEYERRLREEW